MIKIRDLGIINLGSLRKVDRILKKIKVKCQQTISIDFSECLIDYNVTYLLLDHILQKARCCNKTQVIRLEYDLNFSKAHVLNCMFLGSIELGITDHHEVLESELEEALNKWCKKNKIVIDLVLKPIFEGTPDQYKYGR